MGWCVLHTLKNGTVALVATVGTAGSIAFHEQSCVKRVNYLGGRMATVSPKAGETSWSGLEVIDLLEFPCTIFPLFANVYWTYEYGSCLTLVEVQLRRSILVKHKRDIQQWNVARKKLKSWDKYRYKWWNLTRRHRIWYWMASMINETVEMTNNYFHGYAQTIFPWHIYIYPIYICIQYENDFGVTYCLSRI